MRRVGVVTDSTADIPVRLASELEIHVVPCQVFFGEKLYRDGLDLTPESFYKELASSSELPRTSQPAVSSFVEAYHQLLEQEHCKSVVSIHVAGNLSGTLNSAWAAAQTLPEPSRIKVLDSGQVSMGMGWAVVEAARLAQRGGTGDEVADLVWRCVPRLRTVAMIDTLENLYKGGRISQFSATIGSALQIKPLVSLQAGELSVWARVRTRSRALDALVDRVRGWGKVAEMAALHADAEELLDSLVSRLHGAFPREKMLVLPAGSALTTHLGLGAVGVCALLEPDA
ncbi:MAG: DegV family protein [Anaerolineae bacterium]|nr:DegV family protein [Anaerolineae bacterium]